MQIFRDLYNYVKVAVRYACPETGPLIVGCALGTIGELATLATPLLTKYLIDEIINKKQAALFPAFGAASLGILAILVTTMITANFLVVRSVRKSGVRLRLDVLKSLEAAPLQLFCTVPVGQISYRLLQDTQVLEDSWSRALQIVPLQTLLLVGTLVMCLWRVELAASVTVLIAAQVFVTCKFRKPLLRYAEQSKNALQVLNGTAVGYLRRIELIRTLATERSERLGFVRVIHTVVRIAMKNLVLNNIASSSSSAIGNLCSLGLLWYGGVAVMQGHMSLGTLMAFLMFSAMLYRPIMALTALVLSFQDVLASQRRCDEYLRMRPAVTEDACPITVPPRAGSIEFRDVSFSYDSRPILHHMNLKIAPNTIFALVGHSGVGKSTLCRLLVRFYDASSGTILVDGTDIRKRSLRSLRRSVLFMLQNDYVFNGTLWENITYGRRHASKSEVEAAAQAAALDFVGQLPDGYRTRIGDDGINLSGGEAQRVALARAFLLSPKVVILDEPTSSVDAATEERIAASLRQLRETCTIIVVAHRPSTIRIADVVGVMKDGNVFVAGDREQADSEVFHHF